MGKSDKLDAFLKRGGQRSLRHSNAAEVFDVIGPDRERASSARQPTLVTQLLSPKLDLTPQERAIGNCYGAYFEMSHTPNSTEFIREYVDGGGIGGSGYSERQAMISSMVTVARSALSDLPKVEYKRIKPKSTARVGLHVAVPALVLTDAICIHGHTTTSVAIRFQWFVYRQKRAVPTVPDRQRKKLFAGLKDSLNVIGDAWHEAGMNVPAQFGTIEVE